MSLSDSRTGKTSFLLAGVLTALALSVAPALGSDEAPAPAAVVASAVTELPAPPPPAG